MSGDVNLRPDAWSPASAGYRGHAAGSARASLRLVSSPAEVAPNQTAPQSAPETHPAIQPRSLQKLGEAARVLSHLSDLVDNVRHGLEYNAREQKGDTADQDLLASMSSMAREIVEGSRFRQEKLFASNRKAASGSDPKLVAYHAGLKAFHETQNGLEDPRVTRTLREVSSALLDPDGLLARMEGAARLPDYEAPGELGRLSTSVREMLEQVLACASALGSLPAEDGVNRVC